MARNWPIGKCRRPFNDQLVSAPEKLDMVYRFKIQGVFKSVPPDSVVVRKFWKWQRRKGQPGDVRVVDPPAPPAQEEPAAEEPAAVPEEEAAPAVAEPAPEAPAEPAAEEVEFPSEPAAPEAAPAPVETPAQEVQAESPVEGEEAPVAAPAEAVAPVERLIRRNQRGNEAGRPPGLCLGRGNGLNGDRRFGMKGAFFGGMRT
jgi:hypothetical protein